MTAKDEALKTIDASGVRAGQSWKHYKGGSYMVVAVAIDEATVMPVVVYAGHDGIVWTRRLAHFLMNIDGTNTPRFTQVNDETTSPFRRADSDDMPPPVVRKIEVEGCPGFEITNMTDARLDTIVDTYRSKEDAS